jgi:hypothetical protein
MGAGHRASRRLLRRIGGGKDSKVIQTLLLIAFTVVEMARDRDFFFKRG